MKIAHLSPVYPPYKGGMGLVAEEYVHVLRAAGHEVDVFATGHSPGFTFGNAAFMPQLLWKLRAYDVVHLHYPFGGADFFAALAARIFRMPLVTTFHMQPQFDGWKKYAYALYRFLGIERFILKSSQKVLVSSHDYADQYLPNSLQNIVEFPFRIDTNEYAPGKTTVRESLGIPKDSCVFIFVGGMDAAHYFKGIARFLKALTAAQKQGWHAIFVGDGDARPTFEKQADDLGIGDSVHFVGRVKETLPYYRAANVHVLPSINKGEAFGLVTLEAASTGLLSVVSDLPGVRTLVSHEKTGFVIPFTTEADEPFVQIIQWVIDHPEQVALMGERARRRTQQTYAKQDLANDLLGVYNV